MQIKQTSHLFGSKITLCTSADSFYIPVKWEIHLSLIQSIPLFWAVEILPAILAHPHFQTKKKKKFNRVKSRCRESIRSRWFRDGTVKESVRNPGGSSAPSWQTLSHLGVRGVWEDGNCWQHLCTCVRMCVCASAPKRHIWQTWRNNNALLSAGLVPGRGLEARTKCDFFFFRRAENARWRLISICTGTLAWARHMHAYTYTGVVHVCAALTCICLHSNTRMHMWPPGPWLCVCRYNGVPSRAGSVKKTNNKKEDADVLILTLPYILVLKNAVCYYELRFAFIPLVIYILCAFPLKEHGAGSRPCHSTCRKIMWELRGDNTSLEEEVANYAHANDGEANPSVWNVRHTWPHRFSLPI